MNEFYFSQAYQSLSLSARNLFHCMHNKLLFAKSRKKIKYTNNGEISLTEAEFRKTFKNVSQTYLNARNQLIEKGIIRQTYQGGMARGDCATYELLACDEGIPKIRQRWRKYPKENWKSEIPKAKYQLIGKKTQWPKGESGRKTKTHPDLIGSYL